VRPDLPSGTVTFLFTDVEGSTRLLHELGAESCADALIEHRRIVREACVAQGGVEVDTQGDAFFFAFPTAPGALSAAGAMTEALASGPIQVRVGLHTGTPLLTEEGYVGPDVHRAARIGAAGHGGQVLVSQATATLVDLELRDLGEHRFKDLAAAERVFQLGDGAFPPLKSLYRTNLPIPATSFVGREAELATVVELLSSDDVRLLTLTGPGGTGKTRLALQAVAEASERYPDGAWWVPLAPVRDPELVLPSVAQALGVREQPGQELAETLEGQLAGKRLLLLLDNAEHLLPEIAGEVAALRDASGPAGRRDEPRAFAAARRARLSGAGTARVRRGFSLPRQGACARSHVRVERSGGRALRPSRPATARDRAGSRAHEPLLSRAAARTSRTAA
jgi:class 3 adenylate cyclase